MRTAAGYAIERSTARQYVLKAAVLYCARGSRGNDQLTDRMRLSYPIKVKTKTELYQPDDPTKSVSRHTPPTDLVHPTP